MEKVKIELKIYRGTCDENDSNDSVYCSLDEYLSLSKEERLTDDYEHNYLDQGLGSISVTGEYGTFDIFLIDLNRLLTSLFSVSNWKKDGVYFFRDIYLGINAVFGVQINIETELVALYSYITNTPNKPNNNTYDCSNGENLRFLENNPPGMITAASIFPIQPFVSEAYWALCTILKFDEVVTNRPVHPVIKDNMKDMKNIALESYGCDVPDFEETDLEIFLAAYRKPLLPPLV